MNRSERRRKDRAGVQIEEGEIMPQKGREGNGCNDFYCSAAAVYVISYKKKRQEEKRSRLR